MSKGEIIVGRKKDTEFDFYETPKWVTEKILTKLLKDGILNKDDKIYEPCVGAGAILDVLKDFGFTNLIASDIQTKDYICGKKGIDVYKIEENGVCDVIFTNPPYDLMTKNNMLNEFLRLTNKKVILLLNIYFLSSKQRQEMLKKSGLLKVYIHSDRVTMYPYGENEPKNGGTKMFAWMVFEKGYEGKPTIDWV